MKFEFRRITRNPDGSVTLKEFEEVADDTEDGSEVDEMIENDEVLNDLD